MLLVHDVIIKEGGDIGLFITLVTKVLLNAFLIAGTITLETFKNFDWFNKLSVQTFQPLIVIYGRGSFMYHLWGFTSI